MRVLHTSDWHLGHRLYERERSEEQQMALDWLLRIILEEQIEVLLVAGDIFDLANPPNYAREQYYSFLARLRETPCRHVVIVGGNHDSPSMLNAPAAVFRQFNIHIIGAACPDPQDQIIELQGPDGSPECIVAAVPFLRDRDLHYSQAGESVGEREKRLQSGIRTHYQKMAELVAPYAASGIPIITTGHLYAHGATAAEKRSNIYIGNRSNIAAGDFPAAFHYVALGHIHRPQLVGGQEHIRYSGSLIPLDFSELQDQKLVYILGFAGAKLASSSRHPVPTFRRLKQLTGSLEEIKASLEKFLAKRATDLNEAEPLPPWLEIRVSADRPILLLREQLQEIIGDQPAEILAVQLERPKDQVVALEAPLPDLSQLDVEEVFTRRCQGAEDALPEGYDELLASFRELQNWYAEKQGA